MFLSSSDALEERQGAFFLMLWGFLAKGTGLDCFVLALATFSAHTFLLCDHGTRYYILK